MTRWKPRYVTLISGESPCHTLDGLADGFMRWLGKDRVRPHLLLNNSSERSEFNYFRPVYEWAKTGQWTWEVSQSELLILSMRSLPSIEEWFQQGHFTCPIATVDGRDRPPDDTLGLTQQYHRVQIPFRRELTLTIQSQETFPIPMGVVPEKCPPFKPYQKRSISVFFMGGNSNCMRPAFLSVLKDIPQAKVSLGEHIDRRTYTTMLADAKIGISCYGAGFGSYRYFEIPYYGALLIAQPLPLLSLHNFRSRKEALFIQSPPELLETVQWALEHPLEAEVIATAGREAVLRYHLTIHRAKWLASVMEAKMKEVEAQQLVQFPW